MRNKIIVREYFVNFNGVVVSAGDGTYSLHPLPAARGRANGRASLHGRMPVAPDDPQR